MFIRELFGEDFKKLSLALSRTTFVKFNFVASSAADLPFKIHSTKRNPLKSKIWMVPLETGVQRHKRHWTDPLVYPTQSNTDKPLLIHTVPLAN